MRRTPVMSPRSAAALISLAAVVVLAGIVDPALVLTLAPALLLLGLFSFGVRPGEALLERLRAHAAPRVRACSSPRPRRPVLVRPAVRLLASALAMRPPPPAVLHTTG